MLSKILTIMGCSRPTPTYGTNPMERLKELHRMIADPERIFSIGEVLAELDIMEANLPADAIEARGEIYYIHGFLLFRTGRAKESIELGMEALRIDAATPFLSASERALFAYDVAIQAEDIAMWDIAIDAYKQVIPLFDADPKHTGDQRLGVREHLAFCLHEAGRYAEALAVNMDALAQGERLFDPDSKKLLMVLTNLAQNASKLKRLDEARAFLERRLCIATKRENLWHMNASLFQLGVLAFEQGRFREAEVFVLQRLELARKNDDIDRMKDAEEDLAVLHSMIGR